MNNEECWMCGEEISEETRIRNEGLCNGCALTFGSDGETEEW